MASKRAQRRKACSGKQRFEAEWEARRAIRNLRKQTGQHDWIVTYRCEFCGGFHYGHPPARVRQSIAAQAKAMGPTRMLVVE